jgi:energy-coupling factor transport system substrate-specific component
LLTENYYGGIDVAGKYYFSTRDLLVIAVLAAVGGVMSTYVSYLANQVNHLVGVPFGAGNVVAGLHVFWLLLMIAITRKMGAGVVGGVVKGFVEFITGSPHGIVVVLISAIEGVGAELGYWPLRRYRTLAYMLGGGLGAFANVLVFQVLYNSYGNLYLFGAWGLLAFASGAVLAGYFTGGVMDNLVDAGIVRQEAPRRSALSFSLPKALALVLLVLLASSAIYYFAFMQIRGDTLEIQVTGDVAYNKSYYVPDYHADFVTINAKLDGQIKHYPAQDYTGLPLSYVLADARVQGHPTTIDVIGSDLYTQTFDLANVTGNDDLILNVTQGRIWLIAKGYAGGMWVDKVKEIRVY